jgi:cytochrome c
MTRVRRFALTTVLVATSIAVGCAESGRTSRGVAVTFGDAETGRDAIEAYGCGSCHTIPGVDRANATVGPPLDKFGARSFIAGELTNTPENLVRWIMDPQAVEPGVAMPDLGVTRDDAENIAAYLERLD